MSKYCPIANAVTNCTDNCNSCLEKETKKYKLILCEGEPEESIVYANLTFDEVETIKKDMRGELNYQCLITLEGGKTIDTGIIDWLEQVD